MNECGAPFKPMSSNGIGLLALAATSFASSFVKSLAGVDAPMPSPASWPTFSCLAGFFVAMVSSQFSTERLCKHTFVAN